MLNSIILACLLTFSISALENQESQIEHTTAMNGCNQIYSFYLPNNPYLAPGQDLKVRINVPDGTFVSFVDLYLNGVGIDRDQDYPFAWGKPYGTLPHQLREMEEGTYQVKAVIKDVCGRKHTITRQVTVKRVVAVYQPHKPLLPLVSTLQKKYPNSQILEYKYRGKSVLSVKRCGRYGKEIWFDRRGVAIKNVYTSQTKLVKKWVNRCK